MTRDLLLPTEPVRDLESYEARGGGAALGFLGDLGPDAVITAVEHAGLRGRGGGGYPTAAKWRSVREGGADRGERYAVANGAEGEPGTFKDRPLLRRNPFQILEGLAVAAHTVGASEAYVALKASFEPEIVAVEHAIDELARAGWLEGLRIYVVKGPDEYLYGEEKALLEVIEGEDPLPRLVPPYVYGLFANQPQMGWSAAPEDPTGPDPLVASNPTLVNNVETLANILPVLANGPDWYRTVGDSGSPGPLIVTVTGATRRAGYAELDTSVTLRSAIESIGGGTRPGRSIKAVLSGVANPVLTEDELDVTLNYEAMDARGSGLGAAGFIVFDDLADMVQVAQSVSRFLYVESCGQCPACKFGTGEVTAYLERLTSGAGTPDDLELIGARLRSVTDANRCFLGEQEQRVISSIIHRFPDDFARHLGGASAEPTPPVMKLIDIRDGVPIHDERQLRKRPDWTYADDAPVAIATRAARRSSSDR